MYYVSMRVTKTFTLSLETAKYLEDRLKDEANFVQSNFIDDLIKKEMKEVIKHE